MNSFKCTKLLVLGLALTFTAVGCKKKPYGVTPLPGQGAQVGDTGPKGLDEGGRLKPEDVKIGGGELPTWDPAEMNQDRSVLAAQTVHFDYDSATVKDSEKSKVDAVSAALRGDAPSKLLIEGHCDERGTEEYNRSLGERRALALREALTVAGIDPMRMRTVSFGEDKPENPGHDEAAWKQNRRGIFVLLHPK